MNPEIVSVILMLLNITLTGGVLYRQGGHEVRLTELERRVTGHDGQLNRKGVYHG